MLGIPGFILVIVVSLIIALLLGKGKPWGIAVSFVGSLFLFCVLYVTILMMI